MNQLDLAGAEPRRPSAFADSEHYPGIVLRQPYAGLMRIGLKTIETRKTSIKHRGPLRPFTVKGHQGFVRVPRALVGAAVK